MLDLIDRFDRWCRRNLIWFALAYAIVQAWRLIFVGS